MIIDQIQNSNSIVFVTMDCELTATTPTRFKLPSLPLPRLEFPFFALRLAVTNV